MSRPHFALRGGRTHTYRHLAALLERAPCVAWARPHGAPIVVLTAAAYAELAGCAIPAGTFAPSRFCPYCARFVGPGKRCSECVPPTVAATRTRGAR